MSWLLTVQYKCCLGDSDRQAPVQIRFLPVDVLDPLGLFDDTPDDTWCHTAGHVLCILSVIDRLALEDVSRLHTLHASQQLYSKVWHERNRKSAEQETERQNNIYEGFACLIYVNKAFLTMRVVGMCCRDVCSQVYL